MLLPFENRLTFLFSRRVKSYAGPKLTGKDLSIEDVRAATKTMRTAEEVVDDEYKTPPKEVTKLFHKKKKVGFINIGVPKIKGEQTFQEAPAASGLRQFGLEAAKGFVTGTLGLGGVIPKAGSQDELRLAEIAMREGDVDRAEKLTAMARASMTPERANPITGQVSPALSSRIAEPPSRGQEIAYGLVGGMAEFLPALILSRRLGVSQFGERLGVAAVKKLPAKVAKSKFAKSVGKIAGEELGETVVFSSFRSMGGDTKVWRENAARDYVDMFPSIVATKGLQTAMPLAWRGTKSMADMARVATNKGYQFTPKRIKAYLSGAKDAQVEEVWKAMRPESRLAFMEGMIGEQRLTSLKQEGRPGIERPVGDDIIFNEGTVLQKPVGEQRLPGLEGDEAIRKPEQVRSSIDKLKENLEVEKAALEDMPDFQRFTNKRTGELPEVTGRGGEFARTGDEIADELGIDSEELRSRQLDVNTQKDKVKALEDDLRNARAELEQSLPSATRGLVNKLQKQIDDMREARVQKADTVKGRQEVIKGIKQEIVDFANKNLPLRERGKLLATVKNAKTDLDFEKAISRIQGLAEEAGVRDIRTKIESELKGTEPKKKGGIARGKFTPETHRELAEIKEHVKMDKEVAQQRLAENMRNAPEEGFTPEQIRENDLLAMAGLKEMDSKQLNELLANIRSIKDTGRTVRELRAFNRSEEISRLRDAVKEDITGGKDLKPLETFEDKSGFFNMIKTMDNWLQGIDTMFEKLARTRGVKQFTGPLHKLTEDVHASRTAQNKGMADTTTTLRDNFNRIFEVKNGRQAAKQVVRNKEKVLLGTFTKSDGTVLKDFRMSQNEMYKKWMEYQDDSLKSTFEAMGWTDEIMKKIEDTMTPEVRAWAEWQLKEFYPAYGKTIAPVFEQRFGAPFPMRENYSPIRREAFKDPSLDDSILDTAFHMNSATPGSVKARVGSKLDLAIIDGDEVLMRHIMEMEHFKAFEETIRKLRNVFGDGQVRESIRQFHGRDAVGTVNHLINNLASDGIDTAHRSQKIDALRVNFTRAKLGVNVGVFLKQLTSPPAYISEMPNSSVTQFAVGIADFWRHPIQNTRLMMSHPDMKARYEIGAMERDVKLAMSRGHDKRMMTGKDSFLNSLMFTTKVGDRFAILQGGWAVYRANFKAFLKKGLPVEQARKEALDKFMAATNRTQQAGAAEHLSRIQTFGGSYGKLFTMFMTTPQQYYRITSRSIRGLTRGRGSVASNAKNFFVAWVILPAIFQFTADAFTLKGKRQKRAQLVGNMNGIPILGNMWEMLARVATGDDVFSNMTSPGPLHVIDPVVNAASRLGKDDVSTEDFYKAIDDLATILGDLTGVPYGPITRPIKGAAAITSGETNDLRRLIFSEYALGKTKTSSQPASRSGRSRRPPTRTRRRR